MNKDGFLVFSGTKTRYLSEKICQNLGCPLGNLVITYFADGEFVVIEGNDQWKFDKFMTEDEEPYYNEFNEMYQDITAGDLTDDEVYAELKEKLDVENYLDYFAFNIYF